MQQRHNQKKGFNLIEAAIVLGVVGLVVGGIWVGAAAVSENWKVSQTVKATLSIIEGVRNLNKSFTPNQLAGAAAVGTTVDILEPMYNAGVIPKDVFTKCDFTSNHFCDGLWGNNVSGFRIFVIKRANVTGEYYMQVWGPTVSSCIRLATAFGKINFKQYGIKQIDFDSYSIFPGMEPFLTADFIEPYCKNDPGVAVYFYP